MKTWSGALVSASRRAAAAISVRIGTIRKHEVFMASAYAQDGKLRIDGIRAANSKVGFGKLKNSVFSTSIIARRARKAPFSIELKR
jgi:hypothetical protein